MKAIYYAMMFANQNDIRHIGNENSGRYPRGSGERPYQHGGGPNKKPSEKQTGKDIKRKNEFLKKNQHKKNEIYRSQRHQIKRNKGCC